VIHEYSLRQDLAKDDIQHRAACKAKAYRKAERADLAQKEAKERAYHGGNTRACSGSFADDCREA